MTQTLNIPALADFVSAEAVTKAMFRTVRKIRSNRNAEDGTPVTHDGLFMETFTFGKVRLHAYLNLELNRIDVFTNKGYPLSHTSKSIEAARYGAREEIKKIQKRNAYRAAQKRAA